DEAALPVATYEVLDDCPRLDEREVPVGDDGRLAERVHGAKLRRREHRLPVALVALHFVLEPELLQEPEDALRAGVIEVVKDDHRFGGPGIPMIRAGGASLCS